MSTAGSSVAGSVDDEGAEEAHRHLVSAMKWLWYMCEPALRSVYS